MSRLSNRTILITGAAQGIGAAYATTLATEGARLALCDLDAPTNTVNAVRKLGGDVVGVGCDVTDSAAVANFVKVAAEEFGSIDGLVNNAALFANVRPRQFEEFSSNEFDRILQVNVRGTFECIKAVLPTMRKQRYGKIVNIASSTVFKGTPMWLPYVSSKGAIIALTRAVAREVGNDGIRVNCLSPGLTLSDGIKSNKHLSPEMVNANARTRCLPRDQLPEDLTGTAVFLLSTDSDFMTGQTVVVDGGSVMH